MIKRFFLVVLIVLNFNIYIFGIISNWSNERIYIELYGEYNALSLNKVITIKTQSLESVFSASYSFGFNIVYFNEILNSLGALYIKKDDMEIINEIKNLVDINDNYKINGKEEFKIHYIGAGYRKYFFMERFDINTPLFFLGIDAGIFFPVNTKSELTLYDNSENEIGRGVISFDSIYPGGNIEVGMNYWVNNYIGIFISSGFHIAILNLNFNTFGEESFFNNVEINKIYNLGSFFGILGVSFKFH